MSQPQANEAEKNVEMWKVKKLIKSLEMARGNGTSMISLIIRAFARSLRDCHITDDHHHSAQGSGIASSQNVG